MHLRLLPLHLLLAGLGAGAAADGDADALLAVKAALSDPTGGLASWRNGTAACDGDEGHYAWAGMTCGARGTVVGLDVSGLNLSGALPPALSRLGGLLRLDAAANALSGPVPASLGHLRFLTHLNLSNNAFNGSLPPALARLRPGNERDET